MNFKQLSIGSSTYCIKLMESATQDKTPPDHLYPQLCQRKPLRKPKNQHLPVTMKLVHKLASKDSNQTCEGVNGA